MTVWFSLRRRLLLLLLGGVSAIWAVTVAFSYMDAHDEVDQLFDAQLAQVGQTLLALATHEEDEGVGDISFIAHKYQSHLRFQVWLRDGTLMLRSHNAPRAPMTEIDGFSEENGSDGHWRHFRVWNDDRTLQVQVSEDHHVREDLIGHIAGRLLWPALLGMPIVAFWVWLAIRRGLRSLDVVAGEISGRAPQHLHALEPSRAPEEIRPLLSALNQLFRRVDEAILAEKRFTADAAHELRTPLAALHAQAQVALRARDEEERQRSLGELQSGLMRAAHLVEQMLQLARLDPQSGMPAPAAVDLQALAEAVCAELGGSIIARQLDFSLEAPTACPVAGQPEWLRVLLRNLIDNAIRYTPPGGTIRVSIEARAEAVLLCVEDSGPGIPVEQRETVLRRFARLDPAGPSGCGLGLAIVVRIAELHGAPLHLADSRLGGLAASLSFPRLT